jgi:hypothetical protein
MGLATLVRLNAAYIATRGRTFVPSHPLYDTGMSTDGVINASLEAIRQLHGGAVGRRDEQLIQQCYDAYVALSQTYGTIDYGQEHAE